MEHLGNIWPCISNLLIKLLLIWVTNSIMQTFTYWYIESCLKIKNSPREVPGIGRLENKTKQPYHHNVVSYQI